MTIWFVLEHPASKSPRIVPEGMSWGFFFLGSLWALVQGNWGFLGWWLLWQVPFAAVAALGVPTEIAVVMAMVGILVRVWFMSWFWEKKKQSLLDRGWKEQSVVEGPTRDFAQAEWHRRRR